MEKKLAHIRYDIVPSPQGWRITCNEVVGPAYSTQSDAIRDTLFIAGELKDAGDKVSIRLLELDGPPRVWRTLELQDAHLYRDAR